MAARPSQRGGGSRLTGRLQRCRTAADPAVLAANWPGPIGRGRLPQRRRRRGAAVAGRGVRVAGPRSLRAGRRRRRSGPAAAAAQFSAAQRRQIQAWEIDQAVARAASRHRSSRRRSAIRCCPVSLNGTARRPWLTARPPRHQAGEQLRRGRVQGGRRYPGRGPLLGSAARHLRRRLRQHGRHRRSRRALPSPRRPRPYAERLTGAAPRPACRCMHSRSPGRRLATPPGPAAAVRSRMRGGPVRDHVDSRIH